MLSISLTQTVIRTCAALALLVALSGCDQLTEKPISIAAHVWAGYEPLFLAQREGWLDPAQVQLVETANAVASLQALEEGRVDGAALTLDEVLRAREEGLELSVVLIFDISAGADQLVARPEISSLSQLKGQRVAFEQGALGALMLAEALHAAGLTKADIQPVILAVDRQPEAWRSGELDACVTYEPVASQLMALGAIRVFDSRQIPDAIVDVLAIRTAVLHRAHRAAIRHLAQAQFQALEHLRRNPQDAAYRMAEHMGLPTTEVLPAFKGLVLPDARSNRRLLAGDAPPILTNARRISSLLVESGLLQGGDDQQGLVRAEFLPIEPASH